jgi:hypothetical protein
MDLVAIVTVFGKEFVFSPSPSNTASAVGFVPVAGTNIQGILIRFRSVIIFWFRNKLQARQTI